MVQVALLLPKNMIKRYFRIRYPMALLVLVVTLASYYKILSFYFWHDDFTFLYGAVNHICEIEWAYRPTCYIISILYPLFGYHPFPYFLSGIILTFTTAICFYFLVKKLVSKNVAWLLTLLFSAGYVGSGNYLMMTQPITTQLSLTLLLLSLLFLLKVGEIKKRENIYFLLGLIFFALNIFLIPTRSSTHILLILGLLALFVYPKINLRLKIILPVLLISVFITKFFLEPYLELGTVFAGVGQSGVNPEHFTWGLMAHKIFYYLSSVGNYFPIDLMGKLGFIKVTVSLKNVVAFFLGLLIHIVALIYLIKNRKKIPIIKNMLFAFLWMISQYLPYGLVTDGSLETTHRYTGFLYLGFLYLLGVIFQRKTTALFLLAVFLSLINMGQANHYFQKYMKENLDRASFYRQLRGYFHNQPISEGTILYFDAPAGSVSRGMADFFRVGYYASEASLATELGIKKERLKLVDSSTKQLEYLLKESKLDPGKFFSFYYDGQQIINTTAKNRNMLIEGNVRKYFNIDKGQNTQFTYDKQNRCWTGMNRDLFFQISNFSFSLPSTMSLAVRADFPITPLPYTQACINCNPDSSDLNKLLTFLSIGRGIKEKMTVSVSSSGEETLPGSLIDGDSRTYWLSNRQEWFSGVLPEITLKWKEKINIGGIVITSSFSKRRPVKLLITYNGNSQEIIASTINQNQSAFIINDVNWVSDSLKIKITATAGDAPGIEEIDIIPKDYQNINFTQAYKLEEAPASFMRSHSDLKVVSGYLKFGAKACLEWKAENYGRGKEPVVLYLDGQTHYYSVNLPTMGLSSPIFNIGCLAYPINYKVYSVSMKTSGL